MCVFLRGRFIAKMTRLTRIGITTFVASAALFGQAVSTSQVSGVVQDATGLGIPGAEVKITQNDTGFVRTATSGVDGAYLLPNLPVGPYQLQASKQGFATYVQNGIVLQVNSNPAINPVLKVGAVSEQVSVEASVALVETHSKIGRAHV